MQWTSLTDLFFLDSRRSPASNDVRERNSWDIRIWAILQVSSVANVMLVTCPYLSVLVIRALYHMAVSSKSNIASVIRRVCPWSHRPMYRLFCAGLLILIKAHVRDNSCRGVVRCLHAHTQSMIVELSSLVSIRWATVSSTFVPVVFVRRKLVASLAIFIVPLCVVGVL